MKGGFFHPVPVLPPPITSTIQFIQGLMDKFWPFRLRPGQIQLALQEGILEDLIFHSIILAIIFNFAQEGTSSKKKITRSPTFQCMNTECNVM